MERSITFRWLSGESVSYYKDSKHKLVRLKRLVDIIHGLLPKS